MPKIKILFITAFFLILLLFAFGLGLVSNQWLERNKKEYALVDEAYTLLTENGLNPMPSGKVIEYGMIKGMVQAYNEPYTVFIEPAQHVLEKNQLEGKYAGIGVRIDKDDQDRFVVYPLPNSPALKAGIIENDRLVQIGNLHVTQDTQIDEVEAALRGPMDETIEVSIVRPPDDTVHKFVVAREEIGLPSVTYNLAPSDNTVGVIQIHVFSDTTPEEIRKAVNSLKDSGAHKFVFDLRNNGGGLVNSAIDSVRLFLRDGIVMVQQYKGKPAETFTVEQPGELSDLSMVLIVNHGTASAAEIFSGSLKANNRVKLVGVPTFGKDTIQLVFDLQDKSSLHVTAAHWWIPGLDPSIKGHGVIPNTSLSDEQANSAEALGIAISTFNP
jgi:carboxyl-terminal processing protease